VRSYYPQKEQKPEKILREYKLEEPKFKAKISPEEAV
jgi:hypothetical protein